MLQRLTNLLLLTITALLFSCGAKNPIEENEQAKAIRTLKASLDSITDRAAAVPKAEELYRQMLLYINEHPKDTLSPKFLYVAAELNETYLGNYPQAFAHYSEITEEYPDSRFTPYALFMKGVIMERYFQKSDKALYYLDEYVKKFPEHRMAEMARQMMETSGIDPDDLVKRFNQSPDSLSDNNK